MSETTPIRKCEPSFPTGRNSDGIGYPVFYINTGDPMTKEIADAIAAKVAALPELIEMLGKMLGWALYGEDCDPWYFTEDRIEGFHADVAQARRVLAAIEGEK